MRTALRLLSFLLLVFGVLVALLGAMGVIDSAFMANVPAPPNHQGEGPGLMRFVGAILFVVGIVASLLDVALHHLLKFGPSRSDPEETSEWRREHERGFD